MEFLHKFTIAVIINTNQRFKDWGKKLPNGQFDRGCFYQNDMKYTPILSVNHARGINFHGIVDISTNSGHYEEIISHIIPNLI